MKHFCRFMAFVLLLVAVTAVFSSCGGGDKDSVTLYVYNWGEYISDGFDGSLDVNAEFEKYCLETLGKKVTVNYSTFASNEDMYAKISSGAAAYDVIIPSDYMINRMIVDDSVEGGLLAPLDLSKIPNYANIEDRFKGENVYYEPNDGNVYSVPYSYGLLGVIYNTSMVASDNENIGSWSLMWDKEHHAKNILQINNSRDAFATAMYWKGYNVNTTDEAEWRAALELLKEQKEFVQGYVMDEIFNKMKSGSAAISVYYAGDFLTMYEDNNDLAFYYPKEGTNIFVDAMCVPYNAPNKDLAMEYINFMCSKEIATANAEYICYASPNKAVVENPEYQKYMEKVHPDAMEILYGYEEQGIELTPYLNLEPAQLTLLNDLWEELKVESRIGNGIYIGGGIVLAALIALVVFIVVRKRRQAKRYN